MRSVVDRDIRRHLGRICRRCIEIGDPCVQCSVAQIVLVVRGRRRGDDHLDS